MGDDYTGSNEPQPDADPMDCNGHGSHVAGIAGGNGVKDDGTAYAGPYNATTHQNTNFRIGPGVAPQASLYALRVFGCDGSTEVVNQAIEWAVDPNGDGNFADRVDVINMSLGSDFGYESDATSVAANNAVLAGVIVVASAGNDGDSTFITGSPGTASRVLSVASSVDATDILDGFRENAPTATHSAGQCLGRLRLGGHGRAGHRRSGLSADPEQRLPALRRGQPGADRRQDRAARLMHAARSTSGANLVAAGALGGIRGRRATSCSICLSPAAAQSRWSARPSQSATH